MTKSSQGSERTAAAISIEAEADWLQQLHSLVLQSMYLLFLNDNVYDF